MSARPSNTSLKSWWRAFMLGEVVVLPATVAAVAVAVASIAIGPKRGDIRVDVALASMATFLFAWAPIPTCPRT